MTSALSTRRLALVVGPLILAVIVIRFAWPVDSGRKAGSLYGLPLEDIEELYTRESLSVKPVAATDEPVDLSLRFSPDDVGKVRPHHILVILDAKDMAKVCLMLKQDSKMTALDQAAGVATMVDTTETLSTAAHASGLVRNNVIVTEGEERYELRSDGSQRWMRWSSSTGDESFRLTEYGASLSSLPDRPLRVGESCQIAWPIPAGAPPEVKAEPPVLEIRLLELADFNGRPAALLEEKQTHFVRRVPIVGRAQGKSKSPEVLMKISSHMRRYVDRRTGRTLWSEMTERILGPESVRKHSEVVRSRSVDLEAVAPVPNRA